MIITPILHAIVGLLAGIFSWLPKVTSLPFGMDAGIQNAVAVWNSFLIVFWPLQFPWLLTEWYIGILVSVMVLQLFFKGFRSHPN